MPRLRFDHYLSIGLVCLALLLYNAGSVPATVVIMPPTYALVAMADVPLLLSTPETATLFANQLSAQAVYVMDIKSGTPLLVKNPGDSRFPASTTKLLTALVSRDVYDLHQEFQVKEEAFTLGTTMGLSLGERISVQNLLYGLLMNSGNDAAFVLANNHPGGYDGFVRAMNELAAELHLNDTRFTNPSGLDQPGHRSTARDLALLAVEVMKDPLLREIVGTSQKVMQTGSGEAVRVLQSTNALLGVEPGVVGVKTGTTLLAGEVLITQVNRQDQEVMIVVMGSTNRYQDTKDIIEWVFAHYDWVSAEVDQGPPSLLR